MDRIELTTRQVNLLRHALMQEEGTLDSVVRCVENIASGYAEHYQSAAIHWRNAYTVAMYGGRHPDSVEGLSNVQFEGSLPEGPLNFHLASLHAMFLWLGARGTVLSVAEHSLQDIARYTANRYQPSHFQKMKESI